MLIALMATLVAEVLVYLGLRRTNSRSKRRDVLIYGSRQPLRIPLVDRAARWLKSQPTKNEERLSRSFVWTARKLVNTKAFEDFVAAMVNKRSRLHLAARKVGIQL